MKETQVWSLGWEDPLEKGMATYSCLENPMDRGYSLWCRKESDITERPTLSLYYVKYFYYESNRKANLYYFRQKMWIYEDIRVSLRTEKWKYLWVSGRNHHWLAFKIWTVSFCLSSLLLSFFLSLEDSLLLLCERYPTHNCQECILKIQAPQENDSLSLGSTSQFPRKGLWWTQWVRRPRQTNHREP